jgi:hypothetical protein
VTGPLRDLTTTLVVPAAGGAGGGTGRDGGKEYGA